MALEQQYQNPEEETPSSFLLDSLYCEEEEEKWEESEVGVESLENGESENDHESININSNHGRNHPSHLPLILLEQDLFWEDEELLSLFSKEKQTHLFKNYIETEPSLSVARGEAVEWMLKVKSHYGFSALTAVLAINFLDRFLSVLKFQKDQPWMIQLAAVTCLSLAAKVEETQVPLLLDLQVEEYSKYVFEAKTIQRMELLVMSTLQWRMNPVTSLSFLDHILRRLGLKTDIHWEFFKKCEELLLFVAADWRFVRYPPSVLATSTMLHVIHQVEPFEAMEYQNQLLGVLRTTKEKINDCYELIGNISNTCSLAKKNSLKRKNQEISGGSNDSWDVGSSSVSSFPEPFLKKIKVQEQKLRMPSLCRVFVDVVSSPR